MAYIFNPLFVSVKCANIERAFIVVKAFLDICYLSPENTDSNLQFNLWIKMKMWHLF